MPHNLTEAGSTIAAIVAHAEEIGAEEVEVTARGRGRLGGDAPRRRPHRSAPTRRARPATTTTRAAETSQAALGLGYPDGPVAYFQYIKAWRESGDFEGLDFR